MQTGPQVVTRQGVRTAVLVPYDEWMRLQASAQPTLKDLLLAADAKQHGLTVVTRNVADFAALGVEVVNPFVV